MLLLEQHSPQLFLLRIPNPHFIPIIRSPPSRCIRLPHRLHLHANFFSQPLQVQQRQHPFHFHLINLFQLRPVVEHFRRQVAVVRQEHQPRRRILQIPHGKHALGQSPQTIAQRLAPFRVRHRRHHFRRLVQDKVNAASFLRLDDSPRRLNPVLRRVRLRPQLPHHVPVHAHLSAGNQQLSMPPRSNPRPRNNLLQSFFHGFFLKVFSGSARHFVPFFRLDLRLLFPTSLPLYLVFSLSRRRGLLRFAALPLRHSFIVRRRLFQQFLPRFHRRQIRGCSVCFTALRRSSRDARLVSQRILRRRKSLVAPQRFPRQRLKLLQTRQLLQIAQPEPHQKFLRRLVQNRPPHH